MNDPEDNTRQAHPGAAAAAVALAGAGMGALITLVVILHLFG